MPTAARRSDRRWRVIEASLYCGRRRAERIESRRLETDAPFERPATASAPSTSFSGSAASCHGAGPPTTRAPSLGSNSDSWHGHLKRCTSPNQSVTSQPVCVQTPEYATMPSAARARVSRRELLGRQPHDDELVQAASRRGRDASRDASDTRAAASRRATTSAGAMTWPARSPYANTSASSACGGARASSVSSARAPTRRAEREAATGLQHAAALQISMRYGRFAPFRHAGPPECDVERHCAVPAKASTTAGRDRKTGTNGGTGFIVRGRRAKGGGWPANS